MRMLALLILVSSSAKCSEADRIALYDFYVRNMQHINNWDLVDTSAPDSGFSVAYHRDEQGAWAMIGAIYRNFLFPSLRLASYSKVFRNPAQRDSVHFARMLFRGFCDWEWRAGGSKDVHEDWDSSLD